MPRASSDPGHFRPIHYLGSKLRWVDSIRALADELDPAGGTFCDLFAGSGTVSAGFAGRREVVAVDIQEYARVLCSAVLAPPRDLGPHGARLISQALQSPRSLALLEAMQPVIAFEEGARAVSDILPEAIFDLVEQGSFVAQADDPAHVHNPALRDAMLASRERLDRAGLAASADSVITRHFGGLYFSYRQAAILDCLASAARAAPPGLRDSLLAVVLSTASDVVNTVGKHFAQPIRPRTRSGHLKLDLRGKILRDRGLDVQQVFEGWLARYAALPANPCRSSALRRDYRDFLAEHREPVGVLYADPPYTRDHYSRFYHALETICLGDDPQVSRNLAHGRDRVSRGVYRADRHQSPFCIRSQAELAFEELFEAARKQRTPMIVSYSPDRREAGARPRLMGVDGILELARQHYRSVDLLTLDGSTHSKLNRVERNAPMFRGAEVFFVCRP